MRFVIQRVTEATCEVDQKITGQITNGFCVLIGIAETDTKNIADKMIRKLLGMRIFGDENGKTNLSLHDIEGSLLLISQFTLYADCRKGNRPSFIKAGNPELANDLYQYIIAKCKEEIPDVQTGIFGADMKISLVNDGPFTILLDSEDLAYWLAKALAVCYYDFAVKNYSLNLGFANSCMDATIAVSANALECLLHIPLI